MNWKLREIVAFPITLLGWLLFCLGICIAFGPKVVTQFTQHFNEMEDL